MYLEEERKGLYLSLNESLADIVDYGVANVSQYGIAEHWAKKTHGQEWLNSVKEKGESEPTTPGENMLAGVLRGAANSQQACTREDTSKIGYALSVNQNGACTHFALATANRILSLQEKGEFPANYAVRIMSGEHFRTGLNESHVCVVLDKLPTDEDYLNSNKVSEENSIVVDSWYAAQGGPLCFSPKEFKANVGDYLEIPENKGAVRMLYCFGARNQHQLENDKLKAEEVSAKLSSQYNSQNSLSSSTESATESSQESLGFEDFMNKYSDEITNFDAANPTTDTSLLIKSVFELKPEQYLTLEATDCLQGITVQVGSAACTYEHFDYLIKKYCGLLWGRAEQDSGFVQLKLAENMPSSRQTFLNISDENLDLTIMAKFYNEIYEKHPDKLYLIINKLKFISKGYQDTYNSELGNKLSHKLFLCELEQVIENPYRLALESSSNQIAVSEGLLSKPVDSSKNKLEIRLNYKYGKDGKSRSHLIPVIPVKYQGPKRQYYGLVGDNLKRAILDDFKDSLEE
ncbi:hypothetical protein BN59_02531 [Legionella massiliensis]|uniref:DrrA phosphatidylinositol 4-phosphate binding domain-containing protein n=1 Tax=Legionella massiliensis TaxID=1034943 RepID=A0A078L2I8_9GAMM|nr:hypothetical protein [Legionella massiliensis]CDZ78223.1 hypothetical protein BN59_02531 [Legionella massiliensis]CEE13961.1 hypothetical protein BN1094_02531 [Legionella massiliensis]